MRGKEWEMSAQFSKTHQRVKTFRQKSSWGGKSVKDSYIDKLQNYYGSAIRGNSNNLIAMKYNRQKIRTQERSSSCCSGGHKAHVQRTCKNTTSRKVFARTNAKQKKINEQYNLLANSEKTFVQIETLRLGVYDAVGTFNEGNAFICKFLKRLNIEYGYFSTLKCMLPYPSYHKIFLMDGC